MVCQDISHIKDIFTLLALRVHVCYVYRATVNVYLIWPSYRVFCVYFWIKICWELICLQSTHERKCPICKIARVDVELNYCTPTSWLLDQSKPTSPDVLQFLYTSRLSNTSVHAYTGQHKTCASNTFPQFSFIITRKLLIKHCFGI